MKFRIKTEEAKPMAIPPGVTNVPVTGNFIMHCFPNLYHTHLIMHVLVLCQGRAHCLLHRAAPHAVMSAASLTGPKGKSDHS